MPPTRTVPPAKAVKTERTHEENQERAYIAASRRSDRSLEARVESARRASEIHKRRTGRSLRVTEQDVINEEMYEEEDDDLPFQYRRLAAHLQTNSADFNRRLQDYLTTHVAMRSALANSYAMNGQQFQGSQQLANAMMFPSPMLAHQQYQQQFMQPQMMQQPQQQPHSPSMHRQAPYPSPKPQQHSFHNRSVSLATPQELSPQSHRPSIEVKTERRLSAPTIPQTVSPEETSTPSLASSESKQRPSFPRDSFSQMSQTQTPTQTNLNILPTYNMDHSGTFGSNNYSSFSLALPAESQMFLGSTLNPNDPLTSMFMAGANPSQMYDFSAQLPQTATVGKQQHFQSYDALTSTHGLNSTLAPSNTHEASLDSGSFFDQAVDPSHGGDATPGLNGESWASFIDTDQWEVPSSSQ